MSTCFECFFYIFILFFQFFEALKINCCCAAGRCWEWMGADFCREPRGVEPQGVQASTYFWPYSVYPDSNNGRSLSWMSPSKITNLTNFSWNHRKSVWMKLIDDLVWNVRNCRKQLFGKQKKKKGKIRLLVGADCDFYSNKQENVLKQQQGKWFELN